MRIGTGGTRAARGAGRPARRGRLGWLIGALIAGSACAVFVAGIASASNVCGMSGSISYCSDWYQGPGTDQTTMVIKNNAPMGGSPTIGDTTIDLPSGTSVSGVSGSPSACIAGSLPGTVDCPNPIGPQSSETVVITTAGPIATGAAADLVFYVGPTPSTAMVTLEVPPTSTSTSTSTSTGVAPCPTVALLPPSLPTGSPNQPYSESITASGGTGPYTFKVSGGSLPPGITLGANGTLEGTPTTPGSYTFDVAVVDAKNCPGTGKFTIDVYQPITPRPCKCSILTAKLDPTSINRKHLAPDKQDFGVGFAFRMTCTNGGGGCTGKIRFLPPEVLAGSLPLTKNFRLNILAVNGPFGQTRKEATFFCKGPCSKSVTGRFEIKMRSRDQLNKLYGRTLAFTLINECAGQSTRQRVRVFVDSHGLLRKPKR